jgi:hypothetical protein
MSGIYRSTEVVWETPEKSARPRRLGKWQAVDRELRANPGKWALIYKTRTHTTVPKEFRSELYERAYRTVYEGTRKVTKSYVRYIGEVLP